MDVEYGGIDDTWFTQNDIACADPVDLNRAQSYQQGKDSLTTIVKCKFDQVTEYLQVLCSTQ